MTDNIYSPPQSELLPEATADEFYIVSKSKLAILYMATLVLYGIYWFYINWRNYRVATGAKARPVLRAIFSIFFTHALFREVDENLKKNKMDYLWSPSLNASLFVSLSIATNILDRLAFKEIGSPVTDIISLLILPVSLAFLLNAQEAINLCQNDPKGLANNQFTVFNWLWIGLGLLLWVLTGFGLADMLGLISLES